MYHRGSAVLATLLAGLYLSHGLFFGGGNRAETFLIPCELALVTFYLLGFRRSRRWCWFAAGLCGGGAFLFKQTGLAALAAACIHVVLLGLLGDLTPRQAWHRCGLLLAGGAAVVLMAVAYLAVRGSLDEVPFAIFTFNRLKLAHHSHDWTDPAWWARWCDRYTLSALRLPILMAVTALIHSGLRRLRQRRRSSDRGRCGEPPAPAGRRYMLLFGLWLAIALVAAVLSPGSSAHRFLPALPPLLLLSGYLIDALKTELRLLDRLTQRASVLAAFVLMAYLASDAIYLNYQKAGTVYWDRRPRIEQGRWTVNPTVWQQVGDEVAAITTPRDTIQCWDYTPQVYLQARRRNACRFAADWYNAMVPAGSVRIDQAFFEALQVRPPKVIVITAGRYEALCNARPGAAGEASPAGRWLNANYRRLEELTRGNLYVLARK